MILSRWLLRSGPLCVVLASACASRQISFAPMVVPERGVIGGYQLGGARAAALAACPRGMMMLPLAERWGQLGLDYAGTCPDVPVPMALRVEQSSPLFCGDELCAVGFSVETADVVQTSGEITSVLRERFGVAQGEPVPEECKKDSGTFAACVRSGRAEISLAWRTPDAILITLHVDSKLHPPIVLFYANERGAAHFKDAEGGGAGP